MLLRVTNSEPSALNTNDFFFSTKCFTNSRDTDP